MKKKCFLNRKRDFLLFHIKTLLFKEKKINQFAFFFLFFLLKFYDRHIDIKNNIILTINRSATTTITRKKNIISRGTSSDHSSCISVQIQSIFNTTTIQIAATSFQQSKHNVEKKSSQLSSSPRVSIRVRSFNKPR